MTKAIDDLIELHRMLFDYHVENHRRGIEVGSPESADRFLKLAAAHAAILTELRATLSHSRGMGSD